VSYSLCSPMSLDIGVHARSFDSLIEGRQFVHLRCASVAVHFPLLVTPISTSTHIRDPLPGSNPYVRFSGLTIDPDDMIHRPRHQQNKSRL
jgi:hypothetical protein